MLIIHRFRSLFASHLKDDDSRRARFSSMFLWLIFMRKTVIDNSFILFFLAYLTPIFYSYFSTDYFLYENSWDEPTYLSFQGALGALKFPGYFASSWIVILLHEIGVSGVYQNLLFDIFIPASVFLLLISSLKLLGLSTSVSRAYALMVVFGSVLFNLANPFLMLIAQQDLGFLVSSQQHFGFWISAMEPYPSFLRTPNPQFSYFLLTGCLYLFLRLKRRFLLLLPIPFLYWSVAISYTFFTLIFFILSVFRPRKYYWLIAINFFMVFSLGGGVFILVRIVKLLTESLGSSRLFAPFEPLLLSPILVWCAAVYLCVFCAFKIRRKVFPIFAHYVYTSAFFCVFLMTNLQVFTKVRLDPKGLQDASGTFIASCLLAFTIHMLFSWKLDNDLLMGVFLRRLFLGIIFVLLLSSQGFSFQKMQYKIFIGLRLPEEVIHHFEANSINAIIPDIDTASRMTLLAPKLMAPPFSYQYSFPEINRLCSLNKELMSNASDYVKAQSRKAMVPENFVRSVEEAYAYYIQQEKISDVAGYRDNDLVCSKTSHLRQDFYTFRLKEDEIWAFFPNWSYLRELF